MFLRSAFVAVLVLMSSDAWAACPCEYTVEGLPGITSAHPIPPEHAACLRPIYRYLKAFQSYAQNSNREKARNAHQANYDRTLKIDWGIPPQSIAADMIATGNRLLAKSTEELLLEKQKLGDPGHIQEIVRDNASLSESMVFMNERTIEYAKCVIKNNLPPTSK